MRRSPQIGEMLVLMTSQCVSFSIRPDLLKRGRTRQAVSMLSKESDTVGVDCGDLERAWSPVHFTDHSSEPSERMTHVVFQSHKYEVAETCGEKTVIAVEHISPGDVLLVEHVVNGAFTYVLNCVLNSGPLFDVLCPRTSTIWSVDRLLAGELEPLVVEKVDSNVFADSAVTGYSDSTVSLGSASSAFNHASPAQATVRSFSLSVLPEGMPPPRITCILACADISPGEEIRIEYRNGPSAIHPYVEPASADEHLSAAELQVGVDAAHDLIMQYATSDAFLNICAAHESVRRSIASAMDVC